MSRRILSSAGDDLQPRLNPVEDLCRQWRDLLDVHLPVFEKNSIWRYSRLRTGNEPEQGWKLHVSATILTAAEVLKAVAPFLKSHDAFYKVPVSLHELKKLNAGIFYGYTQIGKFITIYPLNDEQSVEYAERLHHLTRRFSAPAIPFEARFKPESSVYYRYGAFKINELKNAVGSICLAMRDEKGGLIPDLRGAAASPPVWSVNPFPVERKNSGDDSPLKKHYRVFRALSQRGKGGVYQGLDLCAAAPRPCLLKEGRGGGEVEWDGRDGFWRVKHEAKVLETLRAAGVRVPQIYSSTETENNFYLSTEFVEGANLHVFLQRRRRRLSVARAIGFAAQLSALIARVHAAGWLWRDCKPANLIVTKTGELRPLDFEGACLIEQPDTVSWTTLTIKSSIGSENSSRQTSEFVDLYALGAIMYLLFEGELPAADENVIPVISRKSVPAEMKKLILKLLNPPTAKKFTAAEVEGKLEIIRKKFHAR